ncbi:helix-turn-helix transcriptional regulator [Oricola thermophila]|uniref:Helix-turn-helix transcriptional regulator n=1 Tax=Oricola thermophila TaxID=2742145 RepID=A0A6N1VE87_9HYPH|nr:helix-turn-helix transcriptional regulator [Oricola thermophila]QKV19281.1 helix-turn-helix transcriptional regulator [Oricola thermophila]
MTVAVPTMSAPVTIREIAPQWQVAGKATDDLSETIAEMCRTYRCDGAILFRICNDGGGRKTQTLAVHQIDRVLTDAVIDRAVAAVTRRKGNPETLPVMIPAWRIGGKPAFIHAFPGCPKAHGQVVSAFLSVGQKEFGEIAEMYLASCSLMESIDSMRDSPIAADRPRISTREEACLAWTAEGKTSEEIGIILELSPHTVNHYLGSAARKLGASNRMHAVAKALRLGLIERPV